MVYVYLEVVVESVNFSLLDDVECENEEKQFDGLSMVDILQVYEFWEWNVVSEEEEEMVFVYKVDLEVFVESLNLN